MQPSQLPYDSLYPTSANEPQPFDAISPEQLQALQQAPVDYSSYSAHNESLYLPNDHYYHHQSLFDHQQAAPSVALGSTGAPMPEVGEAGWHTSLSPFFPSLPTVQHHQPTWEQTQATADQDSRLGGGDGSDVAAIQVENNGVLPSGMTMTSNGLQLEDLGHRWEEGEHRGRPDGRLVEPSALGLGLASSSIYDPMATYNHQYVGSTPADDPTCQPPPKRRSSRPSSSSSSEHPSPYFPTSAHHPPWLNMSPRTSVAQHLPPVEPPFQPRHWAAGNVAAYALPRSASLPHLFDYGQSYAFSPSTNANYASLQNSPAHTNNSSLRNSPVAEVPPILSPRDATTAFHSPGSSITNRLALSKLSNLTTPISPPKPKPKPTTPLVDASSSLAILARANRIKFGVVDPSPDSTRKSSFTVKQPRAVSARRNLTEDDAHCRFCSSRIGRVILRGTEAQRSVAWTSAMECLTCSPAEDGRGEEEDGAGDEGEVLRYETTFSAGLDKLNGLELEVVDTRPPAGKTKPVGKRKREAGAEKEFVACKSSHCSCEGTRVPGFAF